MLVNAHALSENTVDPDALSSDLTSRLRGCRLICEVDLDEVMHARLVAAMRVLRERQVPDDAWSLRKHRALVATYLVAEGIFHFEGGNYWPNLSVDGFTRTSLATVFEESLQLLHLEQFRALIDAGARRFLAPILAHGGIPRYCLRDFFTVIVATRRRGVYSAREMVALWREQPSLIRYVDVPVQRFMQFGGDVGLDFLDRCLDLVHSWPRSPEEIPPDRFGLPAYVCEAFLAFAPMEQRIREAGAPAVIPRPMLRIDPWDASGPMLVLPALSGDACRGSWTVVGHGEGARFQTSHSDRLVRLGPANHWSVELHDEDGALLRTFAYAGLARTGAMLFDYESGQLIADPTRLRDPRVWLLSVGGSEGMVCGNDSTPLQPIEVAPQPAGAWEGFALAAFDLASVERLAIGDAQSGTPDTRTFWVRVRGERIALVGEPVSGTLTAAGLPVYSETPGLRLPGFGTLSDASRWHIRVACDGTNHVLDTSWLELHGEDALRRLIPDRITSVQLTARGPLGMDLRTAFSVIPRLRIERPGTVLVPGRSSNDVLGHVFLQGPDGERQHIDVRSGFDAVSATVRDSLGGVAALQIVVPCLQWTLVSDDTERGDIAQNRVRISSRLLRDSSIVLLVVRTRQSGKSISLQLRHDRRILQQMPASTAGEDGRWAFDLRRFADTVRASAESVFALILAIEGSEVAVGAIRAELEVANVRVHQRVVPGNTTLVLSWSESRPLRHRVARLWSLTLPWRSPLVTEIPDDLRGQVVISDSDEGIPPGCYVAEVAIDDGWSAVQRPSLNASSTHQFRVGTEREELSWLHRQPDDDPLKVLAFALLSGKVLRSLSRDEVESSVHAALEAIATLREQNDNSTTDAAVETLAGLLVTDSASLARGAMRAALDWSKTRADPFLAAGLELLPPLAASGGVMPDDAVGLWELCPPLAVVLELPNRANPDVRIRIEESLGVALSAIRGCQVVPNTKGRAPELQRFAELPIEILEAQRRACSLMPKRILDLDMQAAAHFEWLLADKRGAFSAAAWVGEHQRFAERSWQLRSDLAAEYAAVRAPTNLVAAFPIIAFPERVHLAALHVVTATPVAARAAGALRKLLQICPGIVTRSLVLATLLANLPSGLEQHDHA